MKTPREILHHRVHQALSAAFPEIAQDGADLVVPTQSAEHGDYQFNGALKMAKAARSNPRAVAQKIIENLDVADVCDPPEVAGPGFVNFRLSSAWLEASLRQRVGDPRLGVEPVAEKKQYVVDFSSPNVAKPMHVGHIRSTIIGDALVRVLRFLGHDVVGDNHLGDWGTQFGMLILGYKELLDADALQSDPIGELKRIYKLVNERCKDDAEYAERARQELAKLQAGDAENVALWHRMIDVSRGVFERIYARLDIHFDTWHGESFYNPLLGEVVEELVEKGIAREDQGARVVFFPGDDPPPFIIQKRDGAFLYATSDLAAIKYRMREYHPDTMVYLTDGRQQLHFRQLFATARMWGYTDVELVHAWFGTILGADNKPIKTREGEPPELSALLDEAEERALAVVREKQPDLSEEEQREVARVVGIGAVKYSDFSQNRTSDYVFSWDRMLAMQGNTAPYIQYAYARVQSIIAKAGTTADALEAAPPPIELREPTELTLGKLLPRFADALSEEAREYKPNVLTTYLFELASALSSFLEACRVIDSDEPLRSSRLALCHLAGRTLARGLELLGIKTLPRI